MTNWLEKQQTTQEVELGKSEEGGWEMMCRRSIKRALHMTDFGNKEVTATKPVDGKQGACSSCGQVGHRGLPRDGKVYRKEGTRKGVWETQVRRQNKSEEHANMHMDGSRGRGRNAVWLAPLYPVHSGKIETEAAMDNEQQEGRKTIEEKGKGIEISPVDVEDGNAFDSDEQPDVDDEDFLMEEGEFLCEGTEIANQQGLVIEAAGTGEQVASNFQGNSYSRMVRTEEIEELNKELTNCTMVSLKVGKGNRNGNQSPKDIKGISSRKRNLMLLVSPRKFNLGKLMGLKQGTREEQKTRTKEMNHLGKREGGVIKAQTRKQGTVALLKLLAKT